MESRMKVMCFTLWLGLVSILALQVSAHGWRYCFMCAGLGPRSECEANPSEFTFGPAFINCTAPFCTTVNVFLRKTKDHPFIQTHSIARLCDREDKGNWCIFDDKFITCYSTCTRDFCNDDIPNPYLMPQKRIESLGLISGHPPQYILDRANGVVAPHPQAPTHDPNALLRHNSESGVYENEVHSIERSAELKRLNDVSNAGRSGEESVALKSTAVYKDLSKEEVYIVEQQPRAEKWFLKASDQNGAGANNYNIVTVIGVTLCMIIRAIFI